MQLQADLNDLRVFVQVVQSHNFTVAAKRLEMPRSTVSRRVAQLERRLGVRLLQRTTRRVKLTDVGASYYERCAAALTAIDEAELVVKESQLTPRGSMRVTAPHDLDDYFAPMVASFICKYPDVHIAVEVTQRKVDLVAEGFDLALRATDVLPDSSLVARRIAVGEGRLYASPRYLELAGTPREPAELSAHRCIVFGTRRPMVDWLLVHRDGRETHVTVSPHIGVNDPAFARECAAAHAGITFLPAGVPNRGSGEKLVRVLPDWNFGHGGALYIVYPSAKHLSAAVRAFRDHLIEGFAAFPDLMKDDLSASDA